MAEKDEEILNLKDLLAKERERAHELEKKVADLMEQLMLAENRYKQLQSECNTL